MRKVIVHAAPSVLDGTIVPLVVFTALVHTLGLQAALLGSLAWAYSALARRAIGHRRIPGILVLSSIGLTIRLTTLLATGSAFLYFAQPVLATVATAAAFALSAGATRPLVAHLGADFVPVPAETWDRPEVRALTVRLSIVWAVALAANAGLTLWLLSHLSVASFVLAKPFVGVFTTLPAAAISIVAGRRVLGKGFWVAGGEVEPAPLPLSGNAPAAALAAA